MPFRDYTELIEPLDLPIRGKTYRVPPASAEAVVRWRTMSAKVSAGDKLAEQDVITDDELQQMFLGSALEQMRADGVHPGAIGHATTTAIADAMGGRSLAEKVWNSIDPKASTPPAKPRSRAKGSRRSSSTGAASTTS